MQAARCYEELRRRGVRSPDLERNLGNAHFLADDVPRAILAYRRGLRLSPADRTLRASLAEARDKVIFFEGTTLGRPPEDLRPRWLPHAPRTLFALAVVGHVVTCVALMRWWMHRRRWALLATGITLVLTLATTALLFASLRDDGRPVVVIAANGVQLRKGDGPTFPPRYETPVNKGAEARLLFARDGWLQIELAGGEVGWVAEADAIVEE